MTQESIICDMVGASKNMLGVKILILARSANFVSLIPMMYLSVQCHIHTLLVGDRDEPAPE